MITPIDAVTLIVAHSARIPEEAHYHLASLPMQPHRSLMDDANFHIVNRTIALSQIGFDYYSNVVTYRV